MGVRSLGYVRLESTDLDAWKLFAGDFIGAMQVDGGDPDTLSFRIDHHPARLVVRRGEANRMTAMGLEVLDRRELARLAAAVEAAGIAVTTGTAEECAERRVTGFVHLADPGGNPVELYYGPVLDHVPISTPLVSGFVTGDMGMGHVIVSAEDAEGTLNFYIDVLGFVERNTMGRTWFLGCNPRHHTFGIARRRGPGALMHLMVEMASLDDVGLALDRAERLGVPMMNSLGKHTNDHMVSFYVYSPERYAIECGWNGLRVLEEQPTYEITKGAFWGHKFTPPPNP
ncbi:MAG: hsaC 2 [Ilumatobacteraceae bacterium]|nr:hsaC 2 [Ilumatobacteraceae bacterium]